MRLKKRLPHRSVTHELNRPAWISPKLAFLYLQAEAIAETMQEDSPEETALRLAMSRIDEADMALRSRDREAA